jgi:hypothetical protein
MEHLGQSVANLPTATAVLAGAGTQTATVCFGGDSVGGGAGKTAATYEWTGAGSPTTVTITAS